MFEGKEKVLTDILGKGIKRGKETLFKCPFKGCDSKNKKKLSINIEKNKYKCWVCNSYSRSIYKLIRKFGTPEQRAEWKTFEDQFDWIEYNEFFNPIERKEEKLVLPADFNTLVSDKVPKQAEAALSYLTERGITKEKIFKWKIGYCSSDPVYYGRVIIPSFDLEGNLNFFVGRTYINHYVKYNNSKCSKDIIFNHYMVDWDKDIVLVEGPFDSMKIGFNAIPILGSSLRENSKLFRNLVKFQPKIYLALDEDARWKQRILINKLLEYDLEVYDIKIPKNRDVGNLSEIEFEYLKKNAELVNLINRFEFNVRNRLKELRI